MPALWGAEGVARATTVVAVRGLRPPDVGDRRHDLPGHADAVGDVVPSDVVGDEPEDGGERLGPSPWLQRTLGLRSYKTAWTWLHKLRRAMVRPGRDCLTGWVEVDETYVGGVHPGRRGRQTETKALVVVAVEVERGRLGRIRLRRLLDASGPSLTAFVQDAVAPDSLVHTDGWPGYDSLEHHGYQHQVTVLRGHAQPPAQLMPHVHQVVSLLKRWLLGTHHGAVTHEHLDYYLDEFTFRFNRRRSRSRGKLFFRLVQQAVAIDPAPYESLVRYARMP